MELASLKSTKNDPSPILAGAFTLRTRSRLATTRSLQNAKYPNFHLHLKPPQTPSPSRRVRATLSRQLHFMSSHSGRSSSSSQSSRYRSQSTAGEDAPPVGRERLSIHHLAGQPRPRTSSTSTGSPLPSVPHDYMRQRVSSTHIPGSSSSRNRTVPPSRLGPGAGSPYGQTSGANPPDTRGRTYTLEVEQHPERTAEFGPAELSRLPLAPAPIVKLTIRDHTGSTIDPNTELPYLIAHLSLCSENGHPLDGVPGASSQHLLYGTLVSSPQVMRNLRGRVAPYFIFPDVSIRQRGRYSLCISLHRLPVGGNPASMGSASVLASVYTQVFEVVSHTIYIAPPPTQLTQLFIRQGARMT
ncbi:velvet [Pyrrhoderma noxium]|uniref:Velvet n=1 Tax=Pyrrhoderma noxium TaxID=2282107 RepID=A0A286UKM7_9AGAM|nr:velvet [Pyrrhoderma noxium]